MAPDTCQNIGPIRYANRNKTENEQICMIPPEVTRVVKYRDKMECWM